MKPPFLPVQLLDVELTQPMPSILGHDSASGRRYHRAWILVRLHNQPLGMVFLSLQDNVLCSSQCASSVWDALGPVINAHLRADGLQELACLPEAGLNSASVCSVDRDRQRFWLVAPFVSVVVCTRDRLSHLSNCLRSILSLNYPAYEVIVVDNAPKTSATADYVRDLARLKPNLRYVCEKSPGLALARNCGLRNARGEIIAYLDDDEVADPNWLIELARGFQQAVNAVCVTGLILPIELETEEQCWLEEFGGLNKGRGFLRQCFSLQSPPPSDHFYPYLASRFGSGGNMAFKVDAIRQLGGFDPALGAGTLTGSAEDTELFFRVVTNGYTLVFEPSAIVRHSHRTEYAGLRRQIQSYGIGFTAYLTKVFLDKPSRLIELISKAPKGISYLLDPRSPRNEKKGGSYPADLTISELLGMLWGPFAYLASCLRLRKSRNTVN